MDERTLKFAEELKKYKTNEIKNFDNGKSKEQICQEIEAIFDKYGVDKHKTSFFAELSEEDGVITSNSTYPKELAKKIYDSKQKKNEAQKGTTEKDEDKQQNSKHRKFSFCINEIKDYTDAQLKDFLRDKFLTHGWTEEELNKICNKETITYEDKSLPENNFEVNIEGLAFLDAHVEITKLLIKIYVFGKDKEQVLKEYDENKNNKFSKEALENIALYGLKVENMDEYNEAMAELKESGVLDSLSLSKKNDD